MNQTITSSFIKDYVHGTPFLEQEEVEDAYDAPILWMWFINYLNTVNTVKSLSLSGKICYKCRQ